MTPAVREHAEERLRRSFADDETQRTRTEKQNFIDLNAMLIQNHGDFRALPIEKRSLLTPEQDKALRSNADDIRNPKDRSDPTTVKQLNNLIGLSDAGRKAFANTDLSTLQLSRADQTRYSLLKMRIQQGEDVSARRDSTAATKAAAKTAKDAQRAASFWHLDSLAASAKGPNNPQGVTPSQYNHPFIYTAPKAPGLPMPAIQSSPGLPGGGGGSGKPAPQHLIDQLPILQSYKDEAAQNPAYMDYLLHHVEPDE